MHEWIVMHEEGNCDLFPFYFFVEPWGKRLKPILGENLDMLVVIREGKMRECVVQEQYERAGRKVFESLPSAFPHYMERTDSWLGRVEELCGKLEARKGWNEASNAELNAEFAAYCETIQNLNTWGMMITLMEYAKSSFVSDKLYSLVSKHLSSAGSKALPTQVISTLTTPFEPTFLRLERKQAALLALEKKRGKGVSAGIDALWKNYSWLSYGYAGPVLPREHFELEVNSFSFLSEQALEEFESEESRIAGEQERLAGELKLTQEITSWISMAREFMFKKEFRKQLLYRAFAVVEPLQTEIASRCGLSLKQVRYFTPGEVSLLLQGSLDGSIAVERMKLVAYLIEGEQVKVFSGKDAELLESVIVPDKADLTAKELQGQCAFPSAKPVVGKAKIVMNAEEQGKVGVGDILISHSTNPGMIMAMKRAGAIVTDQGGITCHAAIVSRELKIPCVTGVKTATLLFKDGDLVEVDATRGIVRKLSS